MGFSCGHGCVSEREPGRVNGGSQEAFLGGNREGRVPAHLPPRLASVKSNVQKTEEWPRVYPETALVSWGFFPFFGCFYITSFSKFVSRGLNDALFILFVL